MTSVFVKLKDAHSASTEDTVIAIKGVGRFEPDATSRLDEHAENPTMNTTAEKKLKNVFIKR